MTVEVHSEAGTEADARGMQEACKARVARWMEVEKSLLSLRATGCSRAAVQAEEKAVVCSK